MAEAAAIARSPIAAPPASPSRSTGDSLELADWTALAKVLVRAAATGNMAGALAVEPGRARRDGEGTLVARVGPDEWLLFAAPGRAPDLTAGLAGITDENLVTVVDLTSGRAVLRVSGARAPDLLAKVCAVDTGAAPDGTAFRSDVAGVVTEVIRDDLAEPAVRSYLLACDWSFGQYLFDTLVDAGLEFDVAVTGCLEWSR